MRNVDNSLAYFTSEFEIGIDTFWKMKIRILRRVNGLLGCVRISGERMKHSCHVRERRQIDDKLYNLSATAIAVIGRFKSIIRKRWDRNCF